MVWYLASSLFWWSDEASRGFAFEYKKIIIHAVSRDLASFPHECIFCQLDYDTPMEVEGDEAQEDGVQEEVDDVVRFVPADKASRKKRLSLHSLFCFCGCA